MAKPSVKDYNFIIESHKFKYSYVAQLQKPSEGANQAGIETDSVEGNEKYGTQPVITWSKQTRLSPPEEIYKNGNARDTSMWTAGNLAEISKMGGKLQKQKNLATHDELQ